MSRPNTTDETIVTNLFAKRIITSEGCWSFIGYCNNKGYGMIRFNRKLWLAHRLSIKLFKSAEYDENLQVNHKCANKSCFNPEHLYCGTQVENMIDYRLSKNIKHSARSWKYYEKRKLEKT